MKSFTKDEAEKAIAAVKAKAQTDRNFRKLALENPNEALKQAAGVDVPRGNKIKVIEAAPDVDLTIVLPKYAGADLTDSDLDAVAGGMGDHNCSHSCTDW
ncbi:MAG: NHLP leader peptide family RiPP precursor [Longimicrobiales bacterium]